MELWWGKEGSDQVERGKLVVGVGRAPRKVFLYLSDEWREGGKNMGENKCESFINSARPFEHER